MTKESAINMLRLHYPETFRGFDFVVSERLRKYFTKEQLNTAAHISMKDFVVTTYKRRGYDVHVMYFLDHNYNRYYVAVNTKCPDLLPEFQVYNRFANL